MQGHKQFTDRVVLRFRLSERVPKQNLYRRLAELLNWDFLYQQTQALYSHTGQPSLDPVVFFKLMLVSRLENLVSDRRLVEHCSLRLDILCFLGYEVDEDLPWHSTISRTRQLTNQQLYSWEPVATHRQLGQTLLPDARLDPERIARHWDEVLRLVVTLKLRHSEASRLFGRLNSYARQHPLYRALKELGRLVKTEFLLRYVDQVELRQRIQKQLNKGESAHRLAHAVWHGRNQEFHAATRSEQLVAETCKRLLMNAIICWNYLHLSQHLARLPPEQQAATLATLSHFAVLSYRHLNLHGEYDFSDQPLPPEAPFDMDLIAAW